MSFIVTQSDGSGFVPVPPGMHLARCYRVVDLGTQTSEYMGKVKHLPKVMLQFEVHSESEDGQPLVTSKGEPMTMSKNYTVSLADKATLRLDLQTWRGRDFTAEELRGFDLSKILDQWAMITITRSAGANGKEYSNITGVNPVPANIKKAGLPEPFNPPQMFTIAKADMEMYNTFSEGLKNKIAASPEWKSRTVTHDYNIADDNLDDDVPF